MEEATSRKPTALTSFDRISEPPPSLSKVEADLPGRLAKIRGRQLILERLFPTTVSWVLITSESTWDKVMKKSRF
jgi:hypothetical protein